MESELIKMQWKLKWQHDKKDYELALLDMAKRILLKEKKEHNKILFNALKVPVGVIIVIVMVYILIIKYL